MAASYPSAAKTFSTKATNDTIEASHPNDMQDEITAVETALLNGLAHDLKFTDALYDIGKSAATRPRDLFLSRNLTVGSTVLSDLIFTDATYDIGKSGATRPRDGFFSRNFAIGGTLGVTGVATFTAQSVHNAGVDVSGASAGQIVFPATQNASAGANTLDDYEEGSWTPTLIGTTGGEATYTTRTARYRKVGKWVDLYCYIASATVGTLTGNLRLGGLPFTSAAQVVTGTCVCPHFTTLGSNAIWLGGYVGNAVTVVDINRITASAASVAAAPVATVAASELVFYVHYEAGN